MVGFLEDAQQKKHHIKNKKTGEKNHHPNAPTLHPLPQQGCSLAVVAYDLSHQRSAHQAHARGAPNTHNNTHIEQSLPTVYPSSRVCDRRPVTRLSASATAAAPAGVELLYMVCASCRWISGTIKLECKQIQTQPTPHNADPTPGAARLLTHSQHSTADTVCFEHTARPQ